MNPELHEASVIVKERDEVVLGFAVHVLTDGTVEKRVRCDDGTDRGSPLDDATPHSEIVAITEHQVLDALVDAFSVAMTGDYVD